MLYGRGKHTTRLSLNRLHVADGYIELEIIDGMHRIMRFQAVSLFVCATFGYRRGPTLAAGQNER